MTTRKMIRETKTTIRRKPHKTTKHTHSTITTKGRGLMNTLIGSVITLSAMSFYALRSLRNSKPVKNGKKTMKRMGKSKPIKVLNRSRPVKALHRITH